MSLFYTPPARDRVPELKRFLKTHPLPFKAEIAQRWGRNYLCLGNRVDGYFRTAFPARIPFLEWSGDIGYAEFLAENDTITVEKVAIEPRYRCRKYSTMMLKWSENAAQALKMDLYAEFIINPALEQMVETRGFEPVSFTLNSWTKKMA